MDMPCTTSGAGWETCRPIGNRPCCELHERRLPHIHAIGRPVFLTSRLHGSLPPNRVFPRPIDNACTGPLYLRRLEIANLVAEAIHYRHERSESYDRLVRDETEFRQSRNYIELNPVRAGLVSTPEEFPWSSAFLTPEEGRLPIGLQLAKLPHKAE